MNRSELEAAAEREQAQQAQYRCRIFCCASTPCLSSGATAVREAIQKTIDEGELDAEVAVVATGCMGPCSRGPLVIVQIKGQDEVVYERVTPETGVAIVKQHVKENKPVEEFVLPNDLPFFARQTKVVLENSGIINPERLEDYLARGGYSGLARVLEQMTPEDVCEEITKSGLRGRGGAGFSTGLKWNLVRRSPGDRKFVVANGDEGDPGAYMDRTLMESDPHRVLEGMAIAAYAVGADQGFVYVRGEYPIAAKRVERAIRAAEHRGFLGGHVLDGSFRFRVDVRIGAGAFVCGEETALMASIMGRRGQPVPRPPYPSESGLWNRPTLINNVETFGTVPSVINRSASWFASIGTEKSKGTKIFALAGRVRNTGLIEVPMGITLRDIIFDIGGGIPEDRPFKAAQTGGPSGGCIPAQFLDTPVDYERLGALGSIMGSGGLIIMDDRSCMPDVAKYFMEFCMDESCGKCVPCRSGTAQMHRILQKITNGSATMDDLKNLEDLAVMVRETSLCGLGQNAPNPIVSTLRYFRDEYEIHIKERRCPSGVCQMTEVPVADLASELPRRVRSAVPDLEVA